MGSRSGRKSGPSSAGRSAGRVVTWLCSCTSIEPNLNKARNGRKRNALPSPTYLLEYRAAAPAGTLFTIVVGLVMGNVSRGGFEQFEWNIDKNEGPVQTMIRTAKVRFFSCIYNSLHVFCAPLNFSNTPLSVSDFSTSDAVPLSLVTYKKEFSQVGYTGVLS